MFLRLTDPSHQRRQDLQVLGLLDVKEGEGSEEESEDSLVMETRVRGRRGWVHTAHRACGEGTPSTQPPATPGPVLTQVCTWNGRGSLGSDSITWRVPRARGAIETQSCASLLFLTLTALRLLSRQIRGDILGTWPRLLLFSKH